MFGFRLKNIQWVSVVLRKKQIGQSWSKKDPMGFFVAWEKTDEFVLNVKETVELVYSKNKAGGL